MSQPSHRECDVTALIALLHYANNPHTHPDNRATALLMAAEWRAAQKAMAK